MNEQEVRKLLAEFVFALRDLYLDREVMRATLQEGAARTKVLAEWENDYKNLCLNPPAPISQRVSERFQPLIDVVTEGLTDEGLQSLLTHVRKLNEMLRTYDRQ